jgi:hypothetical protein
VLSGGERLSSRQSLAVLNWLEFSLLDHTRVQLSTLLCARCGAKLEGSFKMMDCRSALCHAHDECLLDRGVRAMLFVPSILSVVLEDRRVLWRKWMMLPMTRLRRAKMPKNLDICLSAKTVCSKFLIHTSCSHPYGFPCPRIQRRLIKSPCQS